MPTEIPEQASLKGIYSSQYVICRRIRPIYEETWKRSTVLC